jgi:raffinose/stachyose/melibiose transport system substrate-binding protein
MDVGTRPGEREVWKETVARFKADHPGWEVDVRLYKDDDYTKLYLPQALASKHPPDIYFQWAGYAVHRDGAHDIARDLTDDLDPEWKSQFDERAFRGSTYGGRHFMIPVGMDVSNVLWYRKSVLAKNGIEPPGNWEEFIVACKKLKAAGVTPIVHGNQAGWPAGNWAAHMAEMYLGIEAYDAIGDPNSSKRVRLDDPRIVRAVALLEDLARLGAFNKDIDTLNDTEGVGLFNRAAGAFHFNGGWIIEEFANPDDVGLLRQPTPPGEVADRESVLATAAGMLIHARSAHPREAIDLVRTLTSPLIQIKSVALGRSSAVKAAMATVKRPHQQAVLKILEASSVWVAAPDISWQPADAEEFNRAVKAVVGGRSTAAEALRAAAESLAR